MERSDVLAHNLRGSLTRFPLYMFMAEPIRNLSRVKCTYKKREGTFPVKGGGSGCGATTSIFSWFYYFSVCIKFA